MKKNLLYLSMFAAAVAFAACSTDGDDVTITKESASSSSAPALNASLTEALTLKFNAETAPFKEISFTETNRAIITKKRQMLLSAKRRAEGDAKDEYMVGTYTLTVNGNKNIYNIKDEDGKDYCTVEVTNKETGKSVTAKILRLMSGSEIEVFEAEDAVIAEKVATDAISTKLCREWTVVSTRLRHKDGVTAVKQFDNPAEAASLNAILDYAKTVATITEELDEGTVITSIEFTSDGKFCLFFENGNHYIGKWSWADLNNGYLDYDWNDEEMGNKFMKDGQAIFDVRSYKKVNYYVLTLAAQIEEKDKTYKVELSFYLNEK